MKQAIFLPFILISTVFLSCHFPNPGPPSFIEFGIKGLTTLNLGAGRNGVPFQTLDTGCTATAVSPRNDSCDLYISGDMLIAPGGMFDVGFISQPNSDLGHMIPCDSAESVYAKATRMEFVNSIKLFSVKMELNHGYYIDPNFCRREPYAGSLFIPLRILTAPSQGVQFLWGYTYWYQ